MSLADEQDRYITEAEREDHKASREYRRLGELMKDVCWYNFEVSAMNWWETWRTSDPSTPLMLQSQRYEVSKPRGYVYQPVH